MFVPTPTDSRSPGVDVCYQKCCVCGKVINRIKIISVERSFTCGSICYAMLVFMQGLACGNALCYLVCNGQGKELDEIVTQCHSRHGNNTSNFQFDTQKPVCTAVVAKAMPETDLESNEGEDMLQVSFDQDSSETQICVLPVKTPISSVTVPPSSHEDQLPQKKHSVAKRKYALAVSLSKACTQVVRKKKSKIKLETKMNATGTHSGSETQTEKICDDNVGVPQSTITFSSVSSGNCFNNGADASETGPHNSNKKRVECGICGETFVETHLYVHMKAKHKSITNMRKQKIDLLFPCSECNKTFEKQTHLNKHLTKKHPMCEKLTKSCTVCHKGFSNQTGLSVHMRHAHQTVSPKECDLCEKTFKSCKELSRHKLVDHKLRTHTCHLCGKNFAYRHALKSHLDAHAGVKKHICEVCGEGFVRMTSLCGHRVSAHSKTKSEEVVYKCEYCKSSVLDRCTLSTFTSKALLNKHLFEHHLAGPYAMKDSRKQLSISDEQRYQQCKDSSSGQCLLHAGTGGKTFSFTCSHCQKTFSRAHYLKAHEKQHQEAKYSCDVCCKRFTYKCNLKAHRSTHSSDKPFQCTVCSKKFRLKFLLEDHQRTHNGDLLFKCYICGRGLTRIPNLKRHIRVMHPDVSHSPRV